MDGKVGTGVSRWAVGSGCHCGRSLPCEVAGRLGRGGALSPFCCYLLLAIFSLWGARGGVQGPLNTRHVLLLNCTHGLVSRA